MLFFCAKAQEFGWKEPQKQGLKDWEFDELNQETSGFKALTFAKYFFMSFDANVWQKRTSCKRQQVVFHSKAYLQKNNNNQDVLFLDKEHTVLLFHIVPKTKLVCTYFKIFRKFQVTDLKATSPRLAWRSKVEASSEEAVLQDVETKRKLVWFSYPFWIHGTICIFTYIYNHKNPANVGRYKSSHGWYGTLFSSK